MAASSKIVDLRKLLSERFPHVQTPPQSRVATGLPALDQASGGGLPKGAITELTSPQTSAGSAGLIHHLLQTAERERYFLALIDGRDSFDPAAPGNERLRNLLWIRCTKTLEAVKAADLLLRDGNFPVVILDLILNAPDELRKIPQSNWYRLQRLVEPAPTAFLILTRRRRLMFATIYLPNFYLQAALRHQPELAAEPVGLIDDQNPKPVLIQLTRAAEEMGVRGGMTPSQGLARYLQLVVKTRLRVQEKTLGEMLLQFAFTLAPYVEATAPGICTVEFTDRKRVFEKVEDLIEQLHAARLSARAGIAPTPDASLLAAHLAKPVLEVDCARDFLAPLPVETLAIE